MSSVGLSFGSPTSGVGFDVSTTVSSIMANLSGVEAPWKTQLTTINSQDTVLSSLGTLLSNLSTDMSNLTDATGVLSQKEGSSSNTGVVQLTSASNAAVAGTHTVEVTALAATSSGFLTEVNSSSDTLSGSIAIQVGTAAAQTVTLNSSNNTLTGLASAINSAGLGVSASVLTDASGSRLSLVSGTSGANGNMTVSSSVVDVTKDATPTSINYADTSPYTNTTADGGTLGKVASSGDKLTGSVVLQVGNGVAQTISLTSPNNTISGLASAIGSSSLGVTASVITNSDGSQSVALTSPTVGAAGALTVTSTLSDATPTLGYTNAVSGANGSLIVDGVQLISSSNTVTNLIPGITFQLLSTSTSPVQVVIANYNTGVASTINSMVTDYNSLISSMNAQEGVNSSGVSMPLYGSPTLSMLQQDILHGINATNPNGYVDAVSNTAGTKLAGSLTVKMGTAAAQTFTLNSTDNSISTLAATINSANMGVTAAVVTANGASTLTLASALAGSAGTLTVNSALTATSPTPLTFAASQFSSTTASAGTVGSLISSSDKLTGSIVVQVGSATAQTITLTSPNNTLSALAATINADALGVTAVAGTTGLTLTAQTVGLPGQLTINPYILDSSTTTTAKLNYNASSDINNLSGFGLTVNTDGSLSLNATSLDSVLNSDYAGVQALFQNADSWGLSFSTALTNAGNTSSKGVISLTETANSSIESTLNADISREDALISSESKSLTAELNSANEIMQGIPMQLSGVNELYSAITGYNQSQN